MLPNNGKLIPPYYVTLRNLQLYIDPVSQMRQLARVSDDERTALFTGMKYGHGRLNHLSSLSASSWMVQEPAARFLTRFDLKRSHVILKLIDRTDLQSPHRA